ncbi:MAG: zinc ribbon domain-containing protein [Myxococcota bacterium]
MVADVAKTRKIQIAMGVTAVVGVVVVALGYGIGAILTLGGLGGIIATHFVGGAGTAACPSCGATFSVMQSRRRRVAPCPKCGLWLEGIEQMNPVQADAWEKKPAFCTQLPDSFVWGQQCASCDAPAERMIEVSSQPKKGIVLATVTKINVPACARHADANAYVWIRVGRSGSAVSFRSLGSMQRFAAANGITPLASAEAYWEETEAAQPMQ